MLVELFKEMKKSLPLQQKCLHYIVKIYFFSIDFDWARFRSSLDTGAMYMYTAVNEHWQVTISCCGW